MRLTKTRAVVGDRLSASHWAKVRRVGGASLGSGCRMAGTPEVTDWVGLSQSPRLRMRVSRGSSRGRSVRAVVPGGQPSISLSILALASFQAGTVGRQ